jgi:uncharacterized protein YlxW (UPF0749 family)
VHADLVARVRAAQREVAAQAASVARLNGQATVLRDQALAPASSLQPGLRRRELVAGYLPAGGPGITVRLVDPPRSSASAGGRPGTAPLTATAQLTDRDLRAVVNELWSDGAEAIAVNGARLTPTSAIRFAGQAVLVDYRPISSPYVIQAIGDADVLDTSFADSAVASRYKTQSAAAGIGFSFTTAKRLSLPASVLAGPAYASPAPSATPTATGGHR